eukprot:TRINITY_DN6907_c0_g1_i8.p1 TRINITY_DN6907_c0_g1~~TRINITY_DN6907_c0_g1_i8.p1  ORF type:complete len:148 (+),score=30.47 TRINITY_DN6907_c0_g1_i8:268-711(+)
METETSVDFVKNAFVQTQERAGPPSFVLYNAIDLNRSRRLSNVSFLDKVSQEELQRSLDEHLKGAHLVAKEALELFSNKKKGTLAFSNTPLEIPAPVPVSLVRHAIRGMSLSLARKQWYQRRVRGINPQRLFLASSTTILFRYHRTK